MPRYVVLFVSLGIIQSLCAQDTAEKWSTLLASPPDNSPYYLKATGVNTGIYEVVKRLDENFSIVKVDGISPDERVSLLPVNNNWKLNMRANASNDNRYYIKTSTDVDWKQFKGLKIVSRYADTYLVRFSNRKTLDRLLSHPLIFYISNESSSPQMEARVIDLNLNPNRVNKVHHFFPALVGQNHLVSIKELKYNVDDIDLLGRDVPSSLSASAVSNHASEMATIIAGAGNSFLTGRGVAGNANITSSDFQMVLPDTDADYEMLGVNTQNHSYGTEIESFYGAQASAFDQSAYNNPNLLHVFSSGNQGAEQSSEGVYSQVIGYANLTGNFKMAKNALVVGSVDTVKNEVTFASRGPAYDGRVKPEIVAYSVVGSSNSAAMVSGISTILQQAYESAEDEALPSALAKAVLINSAEDVASPGLDFITGYGNVNAFRSLETIQNGRFFSGSVEQNEVYQRLLVLPVGAINLKVTLCWTDLPSEAGSFKALVNDLDLRLVNGSNIETLPWVLDSDPLGLSLLATQDIDRLNNVEQVTIAEPEANYTIEVEGHEVTGAQDFYLAFEYELSDGFEWDYPTGSDNFPYNGETGSYFRWRSTLTELTGSLEYSSDGGLSWQLLDGQIDVSKGFWRWNSPPEIQQEAIARMRIGGEVFPTETFTISRPIDFSVGFLCGDSVRLQWDQVVNAVRYDVYNLGEQQLEFFESTTDTALVLQNASVIDSRFSVRPILESGRELIPSLTIDFSLQAIECFISSFFQEVALDTGIYLNLRLGTVYGVEQLRFQRKTGNGYLDVKVIDFPTSPDLRILDETPNQGNNTHRIVIDFINGESISQEVTNTFYLTDLPLLVYPNPIAANASINVITKELTSQSPVFRVFDSKGVEVASIPIFGTQGNVPTEGLLSGTYFFRLEDGDSFYSGRLIIR